MPLRWRHVTKLTATVGFLGLYTGFFSVFFPDSGMVARAQTTIYRCGNEYTNDEASAKLKACKVVSGGNVTIVQAKRKDGSVAQGANASSSATAASSGLKVGGNEQKARDADARIILETELRRTEQRLQELKQEYNGGQPERNGSETHNYQKYLDRVASLKAQITRTEGDIASIQRELFRLGGK